MGRPARTPHRHDPNKAVRLVRAGAHRCASSLRSSTEVTSRDLPLSHQDGPGTAARDLPSSSRSRLETPSRDWPSSYQDGPGTFARDDTQVVMPARTSARKQGSAFARRLWAQPTLCAAELGHGERTCMLEVSDAIARS